MKPQEAIKRIEEFGLHHAIRDLPHSAYTVEAFEMAINALKQQEKSRWIPVTERLPEDSQFVLMTIRRVGENYNHEPFISVGYISWNQSVWWCAHDGDCKSKDVKVDAWMPLPEPYREEGEKSDERKR